jgi:capsular polysaccharide export protein
MKTILFISINRHQRQYFRALGTYLSKNYHIRYVHYVAANVLDLFQQPESPEEVGFTQPEINEITSFLRIKSQYRNFGFLRRHLHSRKVLENRAYTAIRYFQKYITKNNVDLVCIWNGNLVPLASAVRVAHKLGKKTLTFENGLLPNTTTVDPQGVNNKNSLVGLSRDFYEKVEPDTEKLRALYEEKPVLRALKSKWYHGIFRGKTKGVPEQVEMPKRYIFMPFQVHDDTQVLLYSPIKTMSEFVAAVVPAVEEYNKQYADDVWIVAKEHPSDFGRTDYSSLEKQYYGKKILFLKYYPTPALIKDAQAIITLNSSVGIEALMQHKQVITLGQAFYNVPGVVMHVESISNLSNAIKIINLEPEQELIDKFLYYLRYNYLVDGSWRLPDESHFQNVEIKIHSIL